MAYIARPSDFHRAAPYPAPAPVTKPRRGFWRGLFDAIMQAHERDAQRAVAQYVARRGKLTDEMEREIAERIAGQRHGSLF